MRELRYLCLWMIFALLRRGTAQEPEGPMDSEDEFSEFKDPDDVSTIDLTEPPSPSSDRRPSPSEAVKTSGQRHPTIKDSGSVEHETDSADPASHYQDLDATDEGEEVYRARDIIVDEVSHPDTDDTFVTSEEFEDVHFKDDEEFEGLQTEDAHHSDRSGPKSSGSSRDNKPDLIIAKVPHHLTRSWDNFHLEFLILCILLIYLLNFLVGRTKNMRLAQTWFAAHKELLEANFSLVGDDGQTQGDSVGLVKESEHLYSIWCSGRSYCEAMLIELRLLKRQCLISLFSNWLKPTHDCIVVKVIMDDSEMDGWVMAVGRKRRLQALVKDHLDLATYCPEKRGQRHPGLPESLVVLNEITEATNALLNSVVCKFLTDNEDYIDYLFFSDQYTGPKLPQEDSSPVKLPVTEKALIFAFRVGNKGAVTAADMEAVIPLFQFIFYVIEKVRRIRLSKEAKAKSERSRQRAYDTRLKAVHSQRQEAAQSRRDERLRAAKERILSEEDPEKARKLEEKEQRKEKAKKQPKMKMVKVKGM